MSLINDLRNHKTIGRGIKDFKFLYTPTGDLISIIDKNGINLTKEEIKMSPLCYCRTFNKRVDYYFNEVCITNFIENKNLD